MLGNRDITPGSYENNKIFYDDYLKIAHYFESRVKKIVNTGAYPVSYWGELYQLFMQICVLSARWTAINENYSNVNTFFGNCNSWKVCKLPVEDIPQAALYRFNKINKILKENQLNIKPDYRITFFNIVLWQIGKIFSESQY